MTLALFVAASMAAPFLLLRGRALRQWLVLYAGAWLLLACLALLARPLGVQIDAYLGMVTFGVCLTAGFFAFVALSDPQELRWSANRAALVAALFYAVTIPLMLRTPIDGDEPYYLLETESMIRDHDLDLANQYRDLPHSATGRADLVPQLGDRTGPTGQQYSRHEPFLPLLMIPGYLIGKLAGALATIALFGVLLARSTVRLFEEEGIDDATTRAVFPLVVFGPPIVFYAARIWPEVPAAFCFVEAVRGVRQRRAWRWMVSLFALVLLKLRFLLIAIVLVARVLRSRWQAAGAIAILLTPLLLVTLTSGSGHAWSEVLPGSWRAMVRGFFGLLLDGSAGILFQAPIYAFGVIAVTRWKSMPAAFRVGMSASLIYLIYLVPRLEWHGGWSPPLRYIVVFMPVLALGVAALWQRIAAAPILAAVAWTIALVAHGMAFPWRLFQIANGENIAGEALSAIWHSDFSRLFPSFIRPNFAAIVASVVAVIVLIVFRTGRLASPAVLAVIMAAAFIVGRRPAGRIEFEDAHVMHSGGELYPPEFQVQRFAYRGGWIVRPGDSMAFLARAGPSALQYSTAAPATIQIGRDAYALPATRGYGTIRVTVPVDGRIELRCLSGTVNLDRMDHE